MYCDLIELSLVLRFLHSVSLLGASLSVDSRERAAREPGLMPIYVEVAWDNSYSLTKVSHFCDFEGILKRITRISKGHATFVNGKLITWLYVPISLYSTIYGLGKQCFVCQEVVIPIGGSQFVIP